MRSRSAGPSSPSARAAEILQERSARRNVPGAGAASGAEARPRREAVLPLRKRRHRASRPGSVAGRAERGVLLGVPMRILHLADRLTGTAAAPTPGCSASSRGCARRTSRRSWWARMPARACAPGCPVVVRSPGLESRTAAVVARRRRRGVPARRDPRPQRDEPRSSSSGRRAGAARCSRSRTTATSARRAASGRPRGEVCRRADVARGCARRASRTRPTSRRCSG